MSDTTTDTFLERWHQIVLEKDIDAIGGMLADDITIGAPPYWGHLEGHDLVGRLLKLILQTIEGFTYHREWRDGVELALEFRGKVGKTELQGVDLITLNEDGKVANIDVLMRPENAISELRGVIGPQMEKLLLGE
ncbi:MAG: hypothetical protein ACI8TX_000721 [Hyphomicrobiaceae bacterium]|jgi:hypothetical protein